jgi:hypothetical protein
LAIANAQKASAPARYCRPTPRPSPACMVIRATENNNQADSRKLSRRLRMRAGERLEAAVVAAHMTDARQQLMIAQPVLLVRPRKTISAITRLNASAHPE